MVNCLIIGHGAREHVIGEALVRNGARIISSLLLLVFEIFYYYDII